MKRPIKLLLIIPTLDRSGAEKQLTLLASGLPKDLFEVQVCLLTRDGPYSEVLRKNNIPYSLIGKKGKLDPRAYWRLKKLIRDFKPDIVHTWLFAANAYGRKAAIACHVPVIIAGERCVDPWKKFWHDWIDRQLAKKTDRIAVNSQGIKDFYVKKGLDPNLFTVIPNAFVAKNSDNNFPTDPTVTDPTVTDPTVTDSAVTNSAINSSVIFRSDLPPASETEGTSQSKTTSQSKRTSQTEETSQSKETTQSEIVAQTEEITQSETATQSKETSQSEIVAQTEGPSQTKRASQSEGASQSKRTSQTESASRIPTKRELLQNLGISVEPEGKLPFLIGMVARLWPQKRIQEAIFACDQLKYFGIDFYMVILGDGPDRDILLRYRNDLHIEDRVIFLGHRSDLDRFWSNFDLFWCTSAYEGQSNSIMEAMAAGIPVIASDIPGNRELVVHKKTGILIPEFDGDIVRRRTAFMHESMTLLLPENEQRRKDYGKAAIERIRDHFSLEQMIQRYSALYISALNEKLPQ